MRSRLMLGPLLYLALVALVWLDQRLAGEALPAWLARLIPGRDTAPPGLLLAGVAALAAAIATRELTAMLRAKSIDSSTIINVAAALVGLLPLSLMPMGAVGAEAAPTLAVLTLVGSLLFYARDRAIEGIMASAAAALLAFVYIGLALGFLLALRRDTSGWVLLYVLSVTKAGDIGAYFSGTAFGKRKLIEWLSPGKTWEGLAGGLVLAGAVGIAGAWILWPDHAPAWIASVGLLSGLLFTLAGLLGDLVASLFKRDAHLKDAGSTLPGYGGIIDIIDSPLLVGPLAYWWLRLVL